MRRKPRSKRKSIQWISPGILAWASTLVLFAIIFVNQWVHAETAGSSNLCQEVKQSSATLSREQLTQLLAIAERAERKTIREVVKEPYCLMSPIEVRAGVEAEREAYPLAFDPKTWLVMLYEGEEYAGYAFSFQN